MTKTVEGGIIVLKESAYGADDTNPFIVLSRAEHFKTTAAVSVTVMLVMYTLYQSVSTKVTATAYIKLIDVWLIFGLILPFVVFFLLVTIDHLPSPPPISISEEKPKLIWKVKSTLEFFAHIILPIIILLFAASYGITAAVIYNS